MRYVQLDENGFVISAAESFVENASIPEGLTPYTQDIPPREAMQYRWVDGVPEFIGEAPSVDHKYDIEKKQWVDDLVSLRARQKVALEMMHHEEKKNYVLVEGVTINADDNSITAIERKLTELELAKELGTVVSEDSLFWRDADNHSVLWSDVASYEAWLKKALQTILIRNADLFVRLTSAKDALSLADSRDAITSIVV